MRGQVYKLYVRALEVMWIVMRQLELASLNLHHLAALVQLFDISLFIYVYHLQGEMSGCFIHLV